jgi:hypothetical protein
LFTTIELDRGSTQQLASQKEIYIDSSGVAKADRRGRTNTAIHSRVGNSWEWTREE